MNSACLIHSCPCRKNEKNSKQEIKIEEEEEKFQREPNAIMFCPHAMTRKGKVAEAKNIFIIVDFNHLIFFQITLQSLSLQTLISMWFAQPLEKRAKLTFPDLQLLSPEWQDLKA